MGATLLFLVNLYVDVNTLDKFPLFTRMLSTCLLAAKDLVQNAYVM